MPKEMLYRKVVLIGDVKSGKTQLLKKLSNGEATFQPNYTKTVHPNFERVDQPLTTKTNVTFQIWDTVGDESQRELTWNIVRDFEIMILCVDLSKPLDNEKIEKTIEEMRLKNASEVPVPLLLVGTKSDERKVSDAEFQALKEQYGCGIALTVSSKEDKGVNSILSSLRTLVRKTLNDQEKENMSDMEKALILLPEESNLYHKIEKLHSQLPAAKEAVIGAATLKLVQDLQTKIKVDERYQAIQAFENEATGHLGSTYPKITALIVGVVIAAVVTIIAAGIGFGVGFAAGAWTGPGAFVSGLAAAGTIAGASVALGAGLGLFRAYKDYKNSMKQNSPVYELTETARQDFCAVQ